MTQYSGKIIRKTPVVPTQQSASGVWTLGDAASATKSNTWPVAAVPNPISRSVRFRSSASANLSRTFTTPTSNIKWTWSGWVKRGAIGSSVTSGILGSALGGASTYFMASFNGDALEILQVTGGAVVARLTTTAVYRDPSAWYHVVMVWDSANATSSSRLLLYVNGVQATAFSTATYPSSSLACSFNQSGTNVIGYRNYASDSYYDGYMTEVNFIDGQALTPSSFGTTDATTGAWIPMPYTGTYGTNGFYLNFKDNSSTGALGLDYSGNGNSWTANNISLTAGSTYDSMVDVPTLWMPYNTSGDTGALVRGNYAVINPVYKPLYQPTISNGNLKVAATATADYQNSFASMGVTSGKWYAEVLVTGTPNSANMIGVSNQTQVNYLIAASNLIGASTGTGYAYYIYNGNKYSANASTAYGNSIASGDVVGIALDLDNGKIWFSKNGTWQASGDPVAGTNAAFTGIASDVWFIGSTLYSGGATSFDYNFGQRPFTYTPPTGFKSLNTFNLPAPTISNGASYMAATLWTGTGATQTISNAVNGVSFQPDLVWAKSRSAAESNRLIDSVRGATLVLYSNLTNAETTEATSLTAFGTSGFTLGSGSPNTSAVTYVGWQWKAGGTSSSNTNGSITSTVSAGATQGFSVVTFNTGTIATSATVGHGLGVAPSMIITKTTAAGGWTVYHKSLGNAAYLILNTTAAQVTGATTVWNSTSPTSSVFTLGSAFSSLGNMVAYCFAEVAGFSKFGSYTGNASTDGPFVYCGFRPRWILIKNASAATFNWFVWDTSRDTYNAAGNVLLPNDSSAEITNRPIDILSNGFKIRATDTHTNGSGNTMIFAAFAETPFKNSNAR